MNFQAKLAASAEKNNSLVCVGLDPVMNKIPEALRTENEPFFTFNKAIIDATKDLVCVYKPQSAFYEAQGVSSIGQLQKTIAYIHETAVGIPVILDAKRGDIDSTNDAYAQFIFDYLEADAVTLQPYLGFTALEPFFRRSEKGLIILCRTSNPGAGEFQDMVYEGKKLYEIVAEHARQLHAKTHNISLVTGGTYPGEVGEIRAIIGDDMWFLVPGIGAQGGDLERTLKHGLNKEKSGLMISSSRGIIFASSGDDFADRAREEARKLRDEINKYRICN